MATSDPWKTWPRGADVTNGTKFGVIVRSDFKSQRTGDYLPMVRVDGGPIRKVWPWEEPRWRVLTEAEAEMVHARREDARIAADLSSDQVDNRRTRDGRATLPKWGPARVIPCAAPNATAEQRAAIERGRVATDDDLPY